jgi:hypothetical protein
MRTGQCRHRVSSSDQPSACPLYPWELVGGAISTATTVKPSAAQASAGVWHGSK